MSAGEILISSLKVIVVGLGTVFAVLVGLIAVIEIIHKVVNREPASVKEASPADKAFKMVEEAESKRLAGESQGAQSRPGEDDEELIAVITAAIAASLNRSTHDIVVRSFKRIPPRAPVWNRVSREEQIATRFWF